MFQIFAKFYWSTILIIVVVTRVNSHTEKVTDDAETKNKNESSIVNKIKRSIENYYMIDNNTENFEAFITTEEPCIGDKEFCNLTKEEYVKMIEEYIYPQNYEWALIATHSVVFVVGLVGNALVCIAVYRNHTMRTVTNFFIVNLAVADFMVILFCLPPTVLWDVTETWFLGDVLCKLLLYFQSVSVTVSVLTLTFISVDRWYAICFPLEFKSTTGRAKTAIIIIWIVSLAFTDGVCDAVPNEWPVLSVARDITVSDFCHIKQNRSLLLNLLDIVSVWGTLVCLPRDESDLLPTNSPEFVVLTTVKAVPLRFELEYLVQCMATWSPNSELIWHLIKVLFIYTVPLMLMSVAYYQIVRVLWRTDNIPGHTETIKLASAEQTQLRSRRKAAKMLVAVVIMFAVCYFPVHLLSVLRYTLDMEQTDVITCLALVSHVLCYANSAINPLIYNFMSGKFRREFKRSFCCSTVVTAENFTTLTRVTTTKFRRPCTPHLMSFDSRQQSNGKIMDTSFIQSVEYKNGL